jgi:hypothetical protein
MVASLVARSVPKGETDASHSPDVPGLSGQGTTAGIVLAQNAGADAKASVDAATEPPRGHAVPVASPARDFQRGRQAPDRQSVINRTVGSSLRRSPGSDVTTCWLLRRAQITT